MAESELAATERRFEALVAGTSDVIAVVSPDSTIRYVSSAIVDVFGRRPDDVIGRRAIRVIHPEDLEVVALLLDKQPSEAQPSTIERATFRMAHADGDWRWVDAMVRNLLDDPAVEGLVVGLRDVTAAKRAEETLAGQTRVLELIARGAPLGETLETLSRLAEDLSPGALVTVMLVDATGSKLVPVAAPSLPAAAIVALSAGVPIRAGSGACGSAAFDRRLVIVEDAATDPRFAEWRDMAIDNGLLACWSTPITNEETGQVLGTFATYYREIRRPTEDEIAELSRFGDLAGIAVERKQAEDRLAHQALHDPLTGLPNRALFLDRLTHAVDQVGRRPGMIAVLFCDLDNFKVVNDWLGHDAGDRVLTGAATRLHATLRAGDTAARFGGDEFVVLCENVQTEHDVVALAERVAVALAEPLAAGTDEVRLTSSIGISVSHTGDVDPEALLRDADTAMYQAKARGKARFELFDNDMRQNLQTRLDVEDALRRAVNQDEL
jgi:diguanylate cyclase (GGDEF)-like protein/PAS domain S-box-containing protein